MAPRCKFGCLIHPLKPPKTGQDAPKTSQDSSKRQLEAPKQRRDFLRNTEDSGKELVFPIQTHADLLFNGIDQF